MADATVTPIKSTVVIKNPKKGFIRKLSSEEVKNTKKENNVLLKKEKGINNG